MSIRKNDQVIVRAGKDRGKKGRVLSVLPEKNRVVVEGVNLIKRHTRPNPQKNIKGGIVEREAAIHASNVMLVDPDTNEPTRIGKQGPVGRHARPYRPQERRSGGQMSKAKPEDAKSDAKSGAKAEAKAKGEARQREGKAKTADAPKATGKEAKPSVIRLRDKYRGEVVPALQKEFGYKNIMAVPKVTKVVVNMGLGEATSNAKVVDVGADELSKITGQKAAVRKAKKSIAQFKVRQGMPIGAMVTLRGDRMYEFLDRLMNIALPRVRDFRGVSPKGFDGRGNYTLGLKDQLIFLEIDYLKVDKGRGMNVSVVTTAKTDEEARKLLQFMGMPFRTN